MNPKKSSVVGRVFDLLDPNSLRSLGLVESQLLGPIGAHTLNGIKESTMSMGYSFLAHRDPIRPGRILVENLVTGECSPWKAMESAGLVEKICVGLIEFWDAKVDDPINWDMIYPPLNTSPLIYVRALEWLTQRYPDAVVVWVELALTYENDLKINYAVDSIYDDCKRLCRHWKVVGHVLGVESSGGSREAHSHHR